MSSSEWKSASPAEIGGSFETEKESRGGCRARKHLAGVKASRGPFFLLGRAAPLPRAAAELSEFLRNGRDCYALAPAI